MATIETYSSTAVMSGQEVPDMASLKRTIFISYTVSDVRWARWIARVLDRSGRYQTIFQERNFPPAANFIHLMDRALRSADKVIAVMSSAYFASAYCRDEWTSAMIKDVHGNDRLLPIRVEPCELPELLKPRIYINLVGLRLSEAKQRLLSEVAASFIEQQHFLHRKMNRVILEAAIDRGQQVGDIHHRVIDIVAALARSSRPTADELYWLRSALDSVFTSLHGLSAAGNVPAEAASVTGASDYLLDRLMELDPTAGRLLPARSKLRGRLGQWTAALSDLQRYVLQFDSVEAPILVEAGGLLLTLGEYDDAAELLRKVSLTTTDAWQILRAQTYQAWIRDYRGDRAAAIRDCEQLLRDAREVGFERLSPGIMHRLGRANLAAALEREDREHMQVARHQLHESAKNVANAFGVLWAYRASEALGSRDRLRLWDETQERMTADGDVAECHIVLERGRRSIRRGSLLLARAQLYEALERWTGYEYRRGAFEAAASLGGILVEIAPTMSDRREAVKVLRLAERLGVILGSPHTSEVRRLLGEALSRLSDAPSALVQHVDDLIAQSPWGALLHRHAFQLPPSAVPIPDAGT